MRMESLVVIILILVISYFCLRTGRRGSAVAIVPLVILPLMNLVGFWTAPSLGKLTGEALQWWLVFVTVGLLVQGTILGGISSTIKSKKVRRTYLIICGGFTIVFTVLIILRAMPYLQAVQ